MNSNANQERMSVVTALINKGLLKLLERFLIFPNFGLLCFLINRYLFFYYYYFSIVLFFFFIIILLFF